MTNPTTTETDATFQPSPAQTARATALRRFNWLYVYTPLLITCLLILILVGFMAWGAFGPQQERTRSFLSGVADVIIIATVLPPTLLCLAPPIGLLALVTYRRRQQDGPSERTDYGRLQIYLWRLGHFIDKILTAVQQALPKIAAPVINAHARASYVRAFYQQIASIIHRS